jgi:hypothetical protein
MVAVTGSSGRRGEAFHRRDEPATDEDDVGQKQCGAEDGAHAGLQAGAARELGLLRVERVELDRRLPSEVRDHGADGVHAPLPPLGDDARPRGRRVGPGQGHEWKLPDLHERRHLAVEPLDDPACGRIDGSIAPQRGEQGRVTGDGRVQRREERLVAGQDVAAPTGLHVDDRLLELVDQSERATGGAALILRGATPPLGLVEQREHAQDRHGEQEGAEHDAAPEAHLAGAQPETRARQVEAEGRGATHPASIGARWPEHKRAGADRRVTSARAQLRQEPQELEVEPDQRHQQAEGGVPLHVAGRAALGAALDEVEVEDEVQRRHGHDDQADQDPDRPVSWRNGTEAPKRPSTRLST